MSAMPFETAAAEHAPTVRGQAVDAVRRVAHASHEARLLKSIAVDAVEDGVRTAKRAVRIAKQDLTDARDDVVYRIKREPLKAVGIAFGSGMVFAAAGGWLVRTCTGRSSGAQA